MGFDRFGTYAEGVHADLTRWMARFDAVPWLHKATSPREARDIVRDGDIGIISNTQNLGAAIEDDLGNVEDLYNAGVRSGQLTDNSQNLIGHGCTERIDAGLSNHGVETVERMTDVGMAVDLSHCGRETTLDAINISEKPVACTHSFSKELADNDRGKSDEELTALKDSDGYVGVLAIPFFLEPGKTEPKFNQIFEHIDYMAERLSIDQVGIGTDWGSWTPEIPEDFREGIMEMFRTLGFREEHGVTIGRGYGPMQQYQDWSAIPEGLEERGYNKEEREKLLGGNFLNVWEGWFNEAN